MNIEQSRQYYTVDQIVEQPSTQPPVINPEALCELRRNIGTALRSIRNPWEQITSHPDIYPALHTNQNNERTDISQKSPK